MVERKLCTGCGACAAVCPGGALRMEEDREGFLYPALEAACTDCGLCRELSRIQEMLDGEMKKTPLSAIFQEAEEICQ